MDLANEALDAARVEDDPRRRQQLVELALGASRRIGDEDRQLIALGRFRAPVEYMDGPSARKRRSSLLGDRLTVWGLLPVEWFARHADARQSVEEDIHQLLDGDLTSDDEQRALYLEHLLRICTPEARADLQRMIRQRLATALEPGRHVRGITEGPGLPDPRDHGAATEPRVERALRDSLSFLSQDELARWALLAPGVCEDILSRLETDRVEQVIERLLGTCDRLPDGDRFMAMVHLLGLPTSTRRPERAKWVLETLPRVEASHRPWIVQRIVHHLGPGDARTAAQFLSVDHVFPVEAAVWLSRASESCQRSIAAALVESIAACTESSGVEGVVLPSLRFSTAAFHDGIDRLPIHARLIGDGLTPLQRLIPTLYVFTGHMACFGDYRWSELATAYNPPHPEVLNRLGQRLELPDLVDYIGHWSRLTEGPRTEHAIGTLGYHLLSRDASQAELVYQAVVDVLFLRAQTRPRLIATLLDLQPALEKLGGPNTGLYISDGLREAAHRWP